METPSLPLVSVVIPSYNRAARVPRAIDSALAQTGATMEVLVVDDGSTDDTRAVVAARYGADPRVRYLARANGGVSAARNTGLRAARGEFIALLDSDDTWLEGKVALQLRCLEAFPEAGMVWTDMAAVAPDGALLHERYLRQMYHAYRWFGDPRTAFAAHVTLELEERRYSAYCGDIYSGMVLGNLIHTSTVLLRRERLERVGLFDERLRRAGEDYDFHLRTCREGPVAYVDAVTLRYEIGMPDAITRPGNDVEFAERFLETMSEALARDRDRINVPARWLRECLADTHAWLGSLHLRAGDGRAARAAYWRSLRADPRRPTTYRSLLVALLPPVVREPLVRARRHARRARPAA